jgi:hypothetical protein
MQIPSIDLASVESGWKLQNRHDSKYLVHTNLLQETLNQATLEFAQLEIDGLRSFTYQTDYFDSADFDSYRQHHRGQRKRFKLRHRHYLDSDLHRLEVKMKLIRSQTKKLSLENHQNFDDAGLSFLRDSLFSTYGESFVGKTSFDLRATAQMHFKRQTLVNIKAQDRITIDSDFLSTHQGKSLILKPDFCIVEIKSENLRSQFQQELLRFGVRSRPFSKYLVTIDALHMHKPGSLSAAELNKYFEIA